MALLGELRRRNIFKVSLAYVLVSWLIVQVASVILPTFDAPAWVMQVLVVFLVLCFPVAALLAWAFELTPEGLKPTADVDRTQSITVVTGRKLNYVVVTLLSMAVIVLVLDNYVFKDGSGGGANTDYRRSIAILPFSNDSAAEENAEFLAAGMHDELLTRLAKISELKVISRTSARRYADSGKSIREIGEELGVGSVVEGTVQRSANSFRINVQLIDARTDETMWAEGFDAELTALNVFSIQSEISQSIAEALRTTLSAKEKARINAVPTRSMLALEAYFRGKQAVDRRSADGIREAIDSFDAAVSIDPKFALAWAGLAEAWLEAPNYLPDTEPLRVYAEAAAAAGKAVALDPDAPDALAAYGWHALLHTYDWRDAEQSLRQALEIDNRNINALHWYSHLLSWQGRFDEAIIVAEQALAADPLSTLMQTNLVYILADARQWDRAFALGAEILEKDSYSALQANLWIDYLRARRPHEAARQLLEWAAATGRDVAAARQLSDTIIRHQESGESVTFDEAIIANLRLRAELPEIYAATGQADLTLSSLEDAYKRGTGYRALLSMKINPSYDFVRSEPRFIALQREVGLLD